MSGKAIQFYKNKVAVNVLAKDIENAKEIVEAIDGHVAVGVLSKQFNTAEEGIIEVEKWLKEIPTVSVGLGEGDLLINFASPAAKPHGKIRLRNSVTRN